MAIDWPDGFPEHAPRHCGTGPRRPCSEDCPGARLALSGISAVAAPLGDPAPACAADCDEHLRSTCPGLWHCEAAEAVRLREAARAAYEDDTSPRPALAAAGTATAGVVVAKAERILHRPVTDPDEPRAYLTACGRRGAWGRA